MVNPSILPFPGVGGALAPPRPLPSPAKGDDFAGAMDDAIGADRRSRPTDSPSRAARRDEPVRRREASEMKPPAPSRNAGSARPPAKHVDRDDEAGEADRSERADAAQAETAAPADRPETPRADAKASGDAAEPRADAGAEAAACAAVEKAGDGAPGTDSSVPAEAGEEHGAEAAAGDPMARGRRWVTTADDQAGQPGEASPGVAARRGTGSPVKAGHAIQQARAQAAATPGPPLAEIAQAAVEAAHADGGGAENATNAPATHAVANTASAPQTASAAEAMTAIENAATAVDSVAGATPAAETGKGGSQTHDQAQPKPQAADAQSNAAAVVAAAGPSDGVRFTVTGAAGNAAYANAAPRGEEAVLPQIVQSIRLHAVQGTTEARVQLKPEHLGALNITLKVEQNQVTATIQADVAAVRSWIESHESSLRQALSEQGLHLAKLVVHPDGQQANRDEQEGERPRPQPRRRSWRDEEPTFEVLA